MHCNQENIIKINHPHSTNFETGLSFHIYILPKQKHHLSFHIYMLHKQKHHFIRIVHYQRHH